MLCHDPRISNDRDHKVETENPALMAAEMLPDVDWKVVASMADWADLPLSERETYDLLRQGALPAAP